MSAATKPAGSSPHPPLDALLKTLARDARVLPWLTAAHAERERARLVAELSRGGHPVPRWELPLRRVQPDALRAFDAARAMAESSPARSLYLARLEELELDWLILDALGDPRRVRPLCARRYGTGSTLVDTRAGPVPLARIARAILATAKETPETPTLPADAPRGEPSACGLLRDVALRAGLDVDVHVDARLSARAATGERSIAVADRRFGMRETLRLAAHEVLGHLVSAANGRAQPLGIFEAGTADSFADQEGLALRLEEEAGVLDPGRARMLAARVLATDSVHAGASFAETARSLMRDEGFSAESAVALAERAHRGGGVARDCAYLLGWVRVRDAIERGDAEVDVLRSGRVSVSSLPELARLGREGLVRRPVYRPSLSRSLWATTGGTSPDTSPPSFAASFTRFELT